MAEKQKQEIILGDQLIFDFDSPDNADGTVNKIEFVGIIMNITEDDSGVKRYRIATRLGHVKEWLDLKELRFRRARDSEMILSDLRSRNLSLDQTIQEIQNTPVLLQGSIDYDHKKAASRLKEVLEDLNARHKVIIDFKSVDCRLLESIFELQDKEVIREMNIKCVFKSCHDIIKFSRDLNIPSFFPHYKQRIKAHYTHHYKEGLLPGMIPVTNITRPPSKRLASKKLASVKKTPAKNIQAGKAEVSGKKRRPKRAISATIANRAAVFEEGKKAQNSNYDAISEESQENDLERNITFRNPNSINKEIRFLFENSSSSSSSEKEDAVQKTPALNNQSNNGTKGRPGKTSSRRPNDSLIIAGQINAVPSTSGTNNVHSRTPEIINESSILSEQLNAEQEEAANSTPENSNNIIQVQNHPNANSTSNDSHIVANLVANNINEDQPVNAGENSSENTNAPRSSCALLGATVLSDFWQYFNSNLDTNFTFEVANEETIEVHGIFMARVSKKFKTMIENKVFKLKETKCTKSRLKQIMEYLYKKKWTRIEDPHTLCELLYFSRKYLDSGYQAEIEDNLKSVINVENAINSIQFTVSYQLNDFKTYILNFIKERMLIIIENNDYIDLLNLNPSLFKEFLMMFIQE